MKENEKNVQYDLIESKKDSSNQNMLNENKNVNRNYNIENHKNFNCLYFLISFIVNFAIAIIAICEYIRRIKNNKLITIFIYFVDIFILIAFIIVFCYFFTKKICFLKGLIYYPFISLFWGSGDFISILNNNSYKEKWDYVDTLKLVKSLLIIFSVIINFLYIKFFKF